jgi:hypothetical protein
MLIDVFEISKHTLGTPLQDRLLMMMRSAWVTCDCVIMKG